MNRRVKTGTIVWAAGEGLIDDAYMYWVEYAPDLWPYGVAWQVDNLDSHLAPLGLY